MLSTAKATNIFFNFKIDNLASPNKTFSLLYMKYLKYNMSFQYVGLLGYYVCLSLVQIIFL